MFNNQISSEAETSLMTEESKEISSEAATNLMSEESGETLWGAETKFMLMSERSWETSSEAATSPSLSFSASPSSWHMKSMHATSLSKERMVCSGEHLGDNLDMGDCKWHESWKSRRAEASLNNRFAKEWFKSNVIHRHADQTERLQWVVSPCYDDESEQPRWFLSQKPRNTKKIRRLQRILRHQSKEFKDPIELERYFRFNIQWRFREVMIREIMTSLESMSTVLLELVFGYI
jgi:hypothetical protein